ncbi:MAG: glycosyltransferase family 2 protein [Acidobacteriota bacterium]|nr:glycosyltransferase family 2 protein [Acidobacteriota bacterium]
MFELPHPFPIIAWFVLCPGFLAALKLFILALAAQLPRRFSGEGGPLRRIVVVIPAHNESLLIQDTVTGVLAQDYPKDKYAVMVIADNCSDNTAQLARDAGARVHSRHDNPGKGQALAEAFDILMAEDWDAVLVMDADTRLDPEVLQVVSNRLNHGAEALQLHYGVLNPAESRRTMVMEMALASFNGLRPRGKCALGMSAGIFGNGFCLSRKTLARVPYHAGSIVEDLEYHLELVAAGVRVDFIDEVRVVAQMPATAADSESQRVRWERGRLAMIRTLGPKLLADTLRGKKGSPTALIDVCMPPVSVVCLSLAAGFALGDSAVRFAALGALAMTVFHYTLASARYGNLGRMARVLAYVPYYFIWKTWAVVGSLLSRSGLGWVRTKRH